MSLRDLQYPRHFVVGEVYAKELFLEFVGDKVLSHAHAYDHLSILATGKVKVTVDGVETVYGPRSAIAIQAGKAHAIEALEPNSLWYCIHAVPEGLRGEDVLDDAVIARKPE